jgi:hypothetical protein
MAAIALLQPAKKVPFGNGWLVTGVTQTVGANQTTEWITAASLGLRRIISAQVTSGRAAVATRVSAALNAQGTGVAEGTNLGDLGIRATSAAVGLNFIVFGEGRREIPNV